MRLSAFNLLVMLLMLTVGIGVGILIVHSSPALGIAADVRPAVPQTVQALRPPERSAGWPAVVQAADTHYVGVTFSRQSADIVARSPGRLEAVYVNLGDRLKPGDVIARIESYSFDRQLQMAEASLRSMQAEQRNAELAVKDSESRYVRREGLAAEGLISREDLETARVQAEKAMAGLEVAQARVAEQIARVQDANQSLAHTVIEADFAGTVAARYLDSGATVQSGTPIVSLMRADDLWVRFAIPEAQQALVSVGSPINFQPEGGAPIMSGAVEYISPVLSVMSQELLIEAKLKVPASLMVQTRAGGSGLVSLVAGTLSDGMAVSGDSLRPR